MITGLPRNQFIGSNAPQNLCSGKSNGSDAVLLCKVAREGNIGRLLIRLVSGSHIDQCGTLGVKAIDAARRASQTKGEIAYARYIP